LSWSQLVRTDQNVSTANPVAVAPSLLSADFAKLADEIKAVEKAGAEFLHLDVMDGHFVPNLTFGPMLVKAIRSVSAVVLDTHLMIENPDKYIPNFLDAGADVLVIHAEASTDVPRDLRAIRDRGRKNGLAINPDNPLENVEDFLDQIDLLLVMSVFPGFGGQSFMESVLPKVERAVKIREQRGLEFAVEIDGGIGPENAHLARNAGADILVAGTAVYRTPDYKASIDAIRGVTP